MLTINNTLDGYLKDVEILGNTIQNEEDLADIRSVGEKVEGQELYEIPVLSRGKNLAKPCKLLNYMLQEPNIKEEERRYATEELILVKTDTSYTFSTKNSTPTKYVIWLDSNKNFISRSGVGGSNKVFAVQSPSNAKYCQLYVYDGSNTLNRETEMLTNEWQFEEGTVATPYEPYQEDKLTILSPVQLEKVGDVADRIIEKDGVWGVEKNVVTYHLKEFTQSDYNSFACRTILPEFGVEFTDTPFYTNLGYTHTNIDYQWNNRGINSIAVNKAMINDQYKYVCDITSETYVYNDVVKMIKDNDIWVKYALLETQFIPLPHDQQVKLRTFANKTNISFLTEIEGTIKAQVPKSIGATVNTHTTQISNLNKELDRVKKLEESTVSTVTTESDFTTVEATSNGYFEDVKLEGKTLVNIYPKTTPSLSVSDRDNPKYNVTKKEGYIKVTGSDLEATNYRYVSMGRINFEMFKPNTTYTIVFTKFRGSSKITIQNGDSQHPIVKGGVITAQDNKLLYTFVTTETLVKSEQILYLWIDPKSTTIDVEAENPMIFEGDLTANPPSGYIEGLKSVGQSATTSEDGVDEIVVSSVNAYGNLWDGKLEVGSLNASGDTDWISYVKTGLIRVKPSSEVICKIGKYKGETATSTDIRMAEYDMNKKFIKFSGGTYKATVSDKTHYVKFAKKLETSDANRVDISAVSDVVVVYGNELHDTPHQSDKKRLLYYNEETQAWEKPILREWDNIEKHADGKYYYHQRSGEVVLNGSEFWELIPSSNSQDVIGFNGGGLTTSSNVLGVVCDKFPTIRAYGENANFENIFLPISNRMQIRILKSKLSTQDVQGFKKWLQTNNITVVYQLAQEKVYECTNIDLITYANETNYLVESGVLSPKSILKVHNNISNVVSLLQKKVSLLESNVTSYMITQNRLMLASRYNADTVSFKVDVATLRNSFEYDNDLYELILNNILVGKDNYNREYIENLIIFYWMDFIISDEMYSTLFEIIEEQHNPKIEEETPLI